jgi:hypothetical protein
MKEGRKEGRKEKRSGKPFCNTLDKKDRKKFDDMFDIPRGTFQLVLVLFS